MQVMKAWLRDVRVEQKNLLRRKLTVIGSQAFPVASLSFRNMLFVIVHFTSAMALFRPKLKSHFVGTLILRRLSVLQSLRPDDWFCKISPPVSVMPSHSCHFVLN